jgi:DNA invertase Pin-like site-specific DNA recombinase
MPDRALLLCRQSLTRADSVSLDHQEERGRDYCESRGYAIVRVIREEDTRGWREDRASMADIRDLAARGGFDVLVAYDTSRVARKLRLLENLIHDLDRRKIRLECVTQEWVSQPLYRQVLGAFDEERSREIGRHVSGAARVRARRGLTWGRVPYGYARVDGVLVPDPVTAPIVARIFDEWNGGASVYQIAIRLIAEGTPPWSEMAWAQTSLRWILRNPVYVGSVRLAGVVVAQDAHEPVINLATFLVAQNRFSAPRVRHAGTPRSWLEGHVVHACGARMSLSLVQRTEPTTRWPDGYPSFRCNASNRVADPCLLPRRNLGAPLLEEAVRRCLIADLRDAVDPATALRRMRAASGSEVVRVERARLTRQLDALADQRREAESLVLTRRRDVLWLDARDAEFRAAQAVLEAKIAGLPAVPDEGALRAAWADVRRFRHRLALVSGDRLGAILARVGVAVVAEPGVSIAYEPPFDALVPTPVTVEPNPRRARG